jgi:hypothetical protein
MTKVYEELKGLWIVYFEAFASRIRSTNLDLDELPHYPSWIPKMHLPYGEEIIKEYLGSVSGKTSQVYWSATRDYHREEVAEARLHALISDLAGDGHEPQVQSRTVMS